MIKVTSGELFVEGGGLPGRFRTAQFHFHWGRSDSEGSEHTLNGHPYPLEASNWFFSSNHLLNHRMLLQSFTSIVSTHFVLIKKVFFIAYLYANNSEIVKLTKLIVTFYWQLWWPERNSEYPIPNLVNIGTGNFFKSKYSVYRTFSNNRFAKFISFRKFVSEWMVIYLFYITLQITD